MRSDHVCMSRARVPPASTGQHRRGARRSVGTACRRRSASHACVCFGCAAKKVRSHVRRSLIDCFVLETAFASPGCQSLGRHTAEERGPLEQRVRWGPSPSFRYATRQPVSGMSGCPGITPFIGEGRGGCRLRAFPHRSAMQLQLSGCGRRRGDDPARRFGDGDIRLEA